MTTPKIVKAPDHDDRPATNWAVYNNDVTEAIASSWDMPKGPSALHELWFPVIANYNPTRNQTRVGFTLQMSPAYAKQIGYVS